MTDQLDAQPLDDHTRTLFNVVDALRQMQEIVVELTGRMSAQDDQIARAQEMVVALGGTVTGLVDDVNGALGTVRGQLLAVEAMANGRDLEAEERRRVAVASLEFAERVMPQARRFRSDADLLDWAVDLAPADGLVLEFGVASGTSLRRIVDRRPGAHGFDCWDGLPEDWRDGFDRGAFAQEVPDVPGATLHVGLFEDTLPAFLAAHPQPWAFAHLDADLYSSTTTVLRLAADRIRPGTVLVFNEYFNYPGWQDHEHRALEEFVAAGRRVEYLAYNTAHEQVAVRVL